jgi:FtsH-binding integral membrane protein
MNENTPTPQNSQELNTLMALANLQKQVKSGASNFYWITALSIINSLGAVFNLGVSFVIGLGVTQVVDALAMVIGEGIPEQNALIRTLGVVLSIGISALFAIFGYLAAKGHRWAFVTGMVFYTLDALVLFAFQDWFGFGFHLFLLWGLFTGLQALKKLQALLPKNPDSAISSTFQ